MSSPLSLFSGISPWIAGVIGGLLANIAANWLWRKYTKPKLVFEKVTETDFVVDSSGDPQARRFNILVRNDGKKAAKNCKPKIRLKGKNQQSKYNVETTVCWAEGDNPARITINPGETAAFEFFKILVVEEEEGVIKTEKSFYVQFPDSSAENETGDIIEWLYDNEFIRVQGADFHDKIEKDLFEKLIWEENNVIVTAENTSKIEGCVSLNTDVEDSQGLVGLRANVIPK